MKRTKIIMSFAIIPLLCSYTNYDSGKIILEYHALTEAIKIIDDQGNNIEHKGESVGGLGHSYIVVHNTKNYNVNVGNYVLKSNDSVSVGLWSSSAFGSSITSNCSYIGSSFSSSSFGSSSSSGNVKLDHSGIMYDYERFYYTRIERPTNDIYLTIDLTESQLLQISNVIKNQNDEYNVVWYNCANFATEIWNLVSTKSYYNGWFRNPGAMHNEIHTDFPNSYKHGNYALKTIERFCFYDTSSKLFHGFGLSL